MNRSERDGRWRVVFRQMRALALIASCGIIAADILLHQGFYVSDAGGIHQYREANRAVP